MAFPNVSVIIPNRDSALINRTIQSVLSQSLSHRIGEVLVVGTDQHNILVERGPVRFVCTGDPVTAPVARNIGIRLATGSFLVFIDADCVAQPGWLEHLLIAQSEGHRIVGGGVSLESNTYWQLCYNLSMFHEFLTTSPAGERQNLGTLNLCVAREVVDQVGLFDENLARGQDTEWTLRMRRYGHRLYFTPKAVVDHLPAITSLGAILRTWYTSGFFNARIRREYRDLMPLPPFYRFPPLLAISSPLIGLTVTAHIFARNLRLLRYFHTLPVIFLTKIAWCWGAARALHDGGL